MRYVQIAVVALLITQVTHAQKKKQAVRDPLPVADSLFAAGNYKAAIPLYVSALKQPQATPNAQPWVRLGVSYHNVKEYSMAVDAFRKAEKISPQLPSVRPNLAKSYSALGDVNSSIVTLDSAISNGFGNYKLLDSDPDFANLRKSDQYSAVRTRAYNAGRPCETMPAARAFDFWLGEWDVYSTSNLSVKAGFNKITRESGGCVILENWESKGAHCGLSLNYFDPSNQKWQQKWSGSGQDIMEFYDGEYVDSVMRFKYDFINTNGTRTPGKLEFTNVESGNVRQHFMRSNDEGKTWQTVYDFTYIRRKS